MNGSCKDAVKTKDLLSGWGEMMQCFLTVGNWGKGEQLPFLHPGMTGVISWAGKGGTEKGNLDRSELKQGQGCCACDSGVASQPRAHGAAEAFSQVPKQHPEPKGAPLF